MKYEIELRKIETKSVFVDAESPQEAFSIVKESEQGFQADYITEILEDSETEQVCGHSFCVYGSCEGCNSALLDDDVRLDSEGHAFCPKCYSSLAEENIGG